VSVPREHAEASKKLGKPEAAETLAAMLKGLSESKGKKM
jgi:hypothetical protein